MFAAALISVVLAGSPPPTLPQLTVNGLNVVNTSGEVAALRGVNLGSWLMLETWISGMEREWDARLEQLAEEAGISAPFKEAKEGLGAFDDDREKVGDYIARLHRALESRAEPEPLARYLALYRSEPPVLAASDFDAALRRRFGDYGAARVWNAYHDTWITETDFQLIKALGFTFVRLPFWYRWFENDDKPGVYGEYGFRYLDLAVEWAGRNGLYVLLDFHGAPGGQSPWDHTGQMDSNRFFVSGECLNRTANLWKAVAARYRDNPTVFGYDTLNEPFSAKDLADWTRVQDALYRAIREGDPDGIVVMEDGYKLEEMPYMLEGFFPKPADQGWSNIMYSFHFYASDNHETRCELIRAMGLREQARTGAPLYCGEFSTMCGSLDGLRGMQRYCSMMNEQGWAWSPWTYKYVDGEKKGAMWGVYTFRGPVSRIPNVHRDSLDELLAYIQGLRTENFVLHEQYASELRACLSQPAKKAE